MMTYFNINANGHAAVFLCPDGHIEQTPFFYNKEFVDEYVWMFGRQWGEEHKLLYRLIAHYKRRPGVMF